MAKKLSAALGVDIGSKSIKLVELRSQGRAPVVTAVGIIETPEGAVDHTGIFNPDAVGTALKQLAADCGSSVKQVVASLQGQSSILVRTLEVPRATPNELKEHMEWEFNRNNPFAEATPMKGFRTLADTDPNSQNMDVVMAIASRTAVETMVSCVRKAGKQLSAIDTEPLAMARVLVTCYGEEYEGKTVCVVNIGYKTTSINIFKDGKLLMPRQVPIGVENLIRSVANGLGLSMFEAADLIASSASIASMASAPATMSNPFASSATQAFAPYNPFSDEPVPAPADDAAEADAPPAPEPVSAAPAATGDSQRVNSAMAGELDEFVAEVRRSIDYFRSRGGDADRVVLAGGGAQVHGMDGFLSGSLGIPCDNLDPFHRLNTNIKKMDPDFLDQHRAELAVAVGNALHIMFD